MILVTARTQSTNSRNNGRLHPKFQTIPTVLIWKSIQYRQKHLSDCLPSSKRFTSSPLMKKFSGFKISFAIIKQKKVETTKVLNFFMNHLLIDLQRKIHQTPKIACAVSGAVLKDSWVFPKLSDKLHNNNSRLVLLSWSHCTSTCWQPQVCQLRIVTNKYS